MKTGLEMIEAILTTNNLDIEVLAQETVRTVALKSIKYGLYHRHITEILGSSYTNEYTRIFAISTKYEETTHVYCSFNYTYCNPK